MSGIGIGYTRMVLPPGVLRKCVDCGKEARTEEELESFTKHRRFKHGRMNLCYDCRNARSRLGGRGPS